MHFKNLVNISKEDAIIYMANIIGPYDIGFKQCHIEKKKRVYFPTKEYSTTRPLELIHTNLCGPMRTKGMIGETYFILFINEYSRMACVYFLKIKLEAFWLFKYFKKIIENEIGLKIKCLRSNHGGEFTSNEFE